MTPIVLVQGTHALDDAWWQNGFAAELSRHGLRVADDDDRFVWDTELDGLVGQNTGWAMAGKRSEN